MFYVISIFIAVVLYFKEKDGSYNKKITTTIIVTLLVLSLVSVVNDILSSMRYQMTNPDVSLLVITDVDDNEYIVYGEKFSFPNEDNAIKGEEKLTILGNYLSQTSYRKDKDYDFIYGDDGLEKHYELRVFLESGFFYVIEMYPTYNMYSDEVLEWNFLVYDHNEDYLKEMYNQILFKVGISSWYKGSNTEFVVTGDDALILKDFMLDLINDFGTIGESDLN